MGGTSAGGGGGERRRGREGEQGGKMGTRGKDVGPAPGGDMTFSNPIPKYTKILHLLVG